MLSKREFQIALIVGLLKDENIFHRLIGNLRPTDFDFPPCRFLFEAILGFFRKYNRQVGLKNDFGALLFQSIEGENDYISEYIGEEDKPALMEVIQEVLDATPMSKDFFDDTLKDFLIDSRTQQTLTENEGNSRALITSVEAIKNDISEIEALEDGFTDLSGSVDNTKKEYVPMGISTIDAALSGGPNRGEFGMIIAGSGIGKTNTVLNFGLGACSTGYRCLLINLELPIDSMKIRWQSMNAMTNPEIFEEPDRKKWDPRILAKIKQIENNEHPIANRLTVYDNVHRNTRMTNDKINYLIENWKRMVRNRYGEDPDEVCALVLVDQFSYMDSSIYERRTDTNVNPQLRVCQEFAKTAKNHNVTLWVPEQINDAGLGKSVLTAKHIAFGRNKQDETDLFFGVAPCFDDAQDSELDLLHGVSQNKKQFKGRYLNFSKIKVRNKQVPWVVQKVWQSATLRFYASKKIAESVENALPTFNSINKRK